MLVQEHISPEKYWDDGITQYFSKGLRNICTVLLTTLIAVQKEKR
jgi:hypothetical protein